MKRVSTYLFVVLMLAFSACTKKTTVVKKSPAPGKSAYAPGQVKKAAGAQSASAFAPGNAKKTSTSSSSKDNGSSGSKKSSATQKEQKKK